MTTQLTQAQDKLRRSEALLADAEQLTHIGSWNWDMVSGEQFWSTENYRIFGLPPDVTMTYERFLTCVHPDDQAMVVNEVQKAIRDHLPYESAKRVVRPDGTIRYIHTRGRVIFDDGGKPVRMFGTNQDVTERQLLEIEILEIGERERRRIGQDLHDDLCQQLTGIAFAARLLQKRLAVRSPSDAVLAAEIVKAVQQALSWARNLARGMHPVSLDAEGLAAALRELAASVKSVFHVSCRLRTRGKLCEFDSTVAIHLYRIAQEAATNAVKHGRAKKIGISLVAASGRVKLAVADDGVGITDSHQRQGMGIPVMYQRARVIGAELTIERRKRGGTVVNCSLRGS